MEGVFNVAALVTIVMLVGLLFIPKKKAEPIPTQVLGSPTYFRSNKGIAKRGLLIGLIVLGVAYYLGSRKEKG